MIAKNSPDSVFVSRQGLAKASETASMERVENLLTGENMKYDHRQCHK